MQVTTLRQAAAHALRRWRADRSGASLVQFVAILPALALLVYGTFIVWQVMSARDRLCNAAWQAARYLQVEGPRFPEEARYPEDWKKVALDFLKEEAAGSELLSGQTLDLNNVTIWPATGNGPHGEPMPPASPDDANVEAVDQAEFAVRFTVDLPHPFPSMWQKLDETDEEKAARSRLTLTCQRLAYTETPPFGATARSRGRGCPRCPDDPPECPPGGTPTPCPNPDDPVCLCACPCRPR